MDTNLANVRLSCGRQYLEIVGYVVAMEGDKCRDSNIPEHVMPPIPAAELATASVGDKRASELPIDVVRFFRGDNWTPPMLEYVAGEINDKMAAELAALREQVRTLREALQEWANYFDSLERHSNPGDPLNGIREQYHGKRLQKTRAALAATAPAGGAE